MNCKWCGKEVDQASKFCPNCGREILNNMDQNMSGIKEEKLDNLEQDIEKLEVNNNYLRKEISKLN